MEADEQQQILRNQRSHLNYCFNAIC